MAIGTFEVTGINRTQVVLGEEQTVFVTPFREEGYAFRIAANLYKVPAPQFLHGERGDIVTFPEPLNLGDIRKIGKYANAGEELDLHRPQTHQEFEEQMQLARIITGLATEQ